MKKDVHDGFVSISKGLSNLDLFVVRSTIKKALDENMAQFRGELLDVGCGKMPYRIHIVSNSSINNYVGVDIEMDERFLYHKDSKPDFFWDGKKLPFEDNRFETIISTEVLEHVHDTEGFLSEVFRVLKPGGQFFFTTPFLWPLHNVPFDEKRLTPFAIRNYLESIGYSAIKIKALGGWHASMALMLGIWVRRSGMNTSLRQVLSFFLRPIILFLYRKDQPPTQFADGQMITGLYGLAEKP